MKKNLIMLFLLVTTLSYSGFEVTESKDDFGDVVGRTGISTYIEGNKVYAIRLEDSENIYFMTSEYLGMLSNGENRRLLIKGENGERITAKAYYGKFNSKITAVILAKNNKYFNEVDSILKNSSKIGVGFESYNGDIIMKDISTMGYVKAKKELGI